MRKLVVFSLFATVLGCTTGQRADNLDYKGRREKNPDRAVDLLSQAIELAPERAAYWIHRGDARMRQGDLDGALADYTESLRLEPGARAHLHRARARREKKQFDLALADLEACAELDPDYKAAADKERERIRAAMTGDQKDKD